MVERDVVVVIFNYRLGLLGRVFSIEFCFVYIYRDVEGKCGIR